MRLRWWEFLADECILLVGPRDDVVRGVANYCVPTWRQFICGGHACKGVLTGRPGEGVAALALDLHGGGDGEKKLFVHGPHPQAGSLPLTCSQRPPHSSPNTLLSSTRSARH